MWVEGLLATAGACLPSMVFGGCLRLVYVNWVGNTLRGLPRAVGAGSASRGELPADGKPSLSFTHRFCTITGLAGLVCSLVGPGGESRLGNGLWRVLGGGKPRHRFSNALCPAVHEEKVSVRESMRGTERKLGACEHCANLSKQAGVVAINLT